MTALPLETKYVDATYEKFKTIRSVLYVGPWLFYGSTTLSRVDAMKDLVETVDTIDLEPQELMYAAGTFYYRLARQLFRRGIPICERPDAAEANKKILAAVRAKRYDVVWMDKALIVESKTFDEIRKIQPDIKIIGYSPDNMCERHNQSLQFIRHVPKYDAYFTTKSKNVEELKAMGARRAEFIDKSYNPKLHRPLTLTEEEKRRLGGPIGFIGTAEKETRATSVAYLADHGVPARVWGNQWEKWKQNLNGKFEVVGPTQVGDMYIKIMCAFDINLCFLRKVNFDQQTCRTMEIPACGKFMLAERTEEHMRLFEEGKEAEFFDSDQEMLDKARYYMEHAEERERIAAAGYERVKRSGYSNQDRLRTILERVDAMIVSKA